MNSIKVAKVVYFSGTGGTEMAARCFERVLSSYGIDVKVIKIHEGLELSERDCEDLLIVLYPVHAFNAPVPIYKWIQNSKTVDKIPAVVISVSAGGEITPNTGSRVNCIKRLSQKGYNVIYEDMLVMPSNVFVDTNVSISIRLIKILPDKIEHIVKGVLSGQTRKTYPNLLNRIFAHVGEIEKYFTKYLGKIIKISPECSGCGWCQESCPIENITLASGKPRFGKKCVACLKCIYGCPHNAIKLGALRFLLVKKGYNLGLLENKMKDKELEAIEDVARGYIWKGVREYLMK